MSNFKNMKEKIFNFLSSQYSFILKVLNVNKVENLI